MAKDKIIVFEVVKANRFNLRRWKAIKYEDYLKAIEKAKQDLIDDLKQTTLNKHTIKLLKKKHKLE